MLSRQQHVRQFAEGALTALCVQDDICRMLDLVPGIGHSYAHTTADKACQIRQVITDEQGFVRADPRFL